MPIRFGIVGAGRIGQIHARIFHSLGCNAVAVINQHLHTAQQVANQYDSAQAYADLSGLLVSGLDFVIVASPWHHHAQVIDFCCEHDLPVYAEKPLFWHESESRAAAETRLQRWQDSHNLIMMNSPSSRLARAVPDGSQRAHRARSVEFTFHTQGPYQGRDIGVDLLSHAWSVIHQLFGPAPAVIQQVQVQPHQFLVWAQIADCSVRFDLAQHRDQARRFSIQIDDDRWLQWQQGQHEHYTTGIQHLTSGHRVCIPDPFLSNAQRFLEVLQSQEPGTVCSDAVWQQQMLLETLDHLAHFG